MSSAVVLTLFACLCMASAYYPSYGPSYPFYGSAYPSYRSSYPYYGSPYSGYYRSAYEDFTLSPRTFVHPEAAPVVAEVPVDAAPEPAPVFTVPEPVPVYAAPEPAPVYATPEPAAIAGSPCPVPIPHISPVVIQSLLPVPFTFGFPLTPQVIDHYAAPNVINYYQSPYIVKHHQSSLVNAYTQKPVIVDAYAQPSVHEAPGPQAVIVEEVCPEAPVNVDSPKPLFYPAPAPAHA